MNNDITLSDDRSRKRKLRPTRKTFLPMLMAKHNSSRKQPTRYWLKWEVHLTAKQKSSGWWKKKNPSNKIVAYDRCCFALCTAKTLALNYAGSICCRLQHRIRIGTFQCMNPVFILYRLEFKCNSPCPSYDVKSWMNHILCNLLRAMSYIQLCWLAYLSILSLLCNLICCLTRLTIMSSVGLHIPVRRHDKCSDTLRGK